MKSIYFLKVSLLKLDKQKKEINLFNNVKIKKIKILKLKMGKKMEPLPRIELRTSSLPWMRSTYWAKVAHNVIYHRKNIFANNFKLFNKNGIIGVIVVNLWNLWYSKLIIFRRK